MTQFNTMKLKSRFSMDFSKKIPPSHETLEMPALFLSFWMKYHKDVMPENAIAILPPGREPA